MSRWIDIDDISLLKTVSVGDLSAKALWKRIRQQPSIDIVRCKECKHRIVNEHYGEKGYIKLKAMCELDTGDIFQLGRHAEDDEWYCADGEREGE